MTLARTLCLRAFLGHHARKPEQAVLRGHIGRLQRRGFVAVHRAHIDERARVLLVHVLDAGLGGEERAIEMDGQHLLPVGEGEFLDRVHDLDAGIGDQDIDRAKRLDRALHAGIDLVFLRYVHADAERRFLARQLLGCRVRGIGIHISDDHPAVCLQIALCDAVTYAACGAVMRATLPSRFMTPPSAPTVHEVVDGAPDPLRNHL